MKQVYRTTGTVVKGNGHSYNLNNKYDAIHLCQQLNQYENNCRHNKNYDKLKQQIIALQMDIKSCQSDLDRIKELL